MSFDLVAISHEQQGAPPARPRRSLDIETEGFMRALPIRWRLPLLALLNLAVAVILAWLIWNGAKALSGAWDEVRQVRESDKLLVLLESEPAGCRTSSTAISTSRTRTSSPRSCGCTARC